MCDGKKNKRGFGKKNNIINEMSQNEKKNKIKKLLGNRSLIWGLKLADL